MNDDKDKRGIDDPLLNQDIDFDRKDDEDFDASDDFHKNDPVTKSEGNQHKDSTKAAQKMTNSSSHFNGEIAI